VMASDGRREVLARRIQADDAYFNDLSLQWAQSLAKAALSISNPPFMSEFES